MSDAAESTGNEPPVEATKGPAPTRHRRIPADPVVLLCFAALIAFPVMAWMRASAQPLAPKPPALPQPASTGSGIQVRDVPVFIEGGAAAAAVRRRTILKDGDEMRRAVSSAVAALVDDAASGAELMSLLADASRKRRSATTVTDGRYPFRYPGIDRLLDVTLPDRLDAAQTAAANDLGALLILAAANFGGQGSWSPTFSHAPKLAFAVLNRARRETSCPARLNLAFLLSTDLDPRDDVVAQEFGAAQRACEDDPTPLWLLGQFLAQRATRSYSADLRPGEQERRALAAFRDLQARFPSSSAGWSGEADSELRLAYRVDPEQPFTARHHFRRALALYRRARRLDRDPALAAGEARAYAGLGLYRKAVRAQREAVAGRSDLAPVQAPLVEYLERAHRFSEAAATARSLISAARFPDGAALLTDKGTGLQAPSEEEADGALSLGVDRLLPVNLAVKPHPEQVPHPAPSTALDLSFLPEFRARDAVTGYDRWCPSWTRRRDLLLAGQTDEALAGMPKRFMDIRPGVRGHECSGAGADDVPLLAAVAELERGAGRRGADHPSASSQTSPPPGAVHDARQNLWRFGGNLTRAARATEQWAIEAPDEPVAFDRGGEIAFLQGSYERAALLFAKSVRVTRSAVGVWSAFEADALLKRGTALEMAGRYLDALATLKEADEVASRAMALARRSTQPAAANRFHQSRYVSYNARARAGDVALRLRRYEEAAEQYDAALERTDQLPKLPVASLTRPEVLDNNRAVVEVRLGRNQSAITGVRRAVAADPSNPVFLATQGFVYERVRRPAEAERAYRAALESDPTVFHVWNDLGVLLAQRGQLRDAATAFRHAIDARPKYALGWFNLGVVSERAGPTHVLASEGAYAHAFRADPSLRDRARRLIPDHTVYVTTLDLSKPLPPRWSFQETQHRAPVAAAGLTVALLLVLRLSLNPPFR